jgi:hypothetical protein
MKAHLFNHNGIATIQSTVLCPYWSPADFDHEIMEIGLVCSNLIEKATTPEIVATTLNQEISCPSYV